jgi:hypothetical protein
MATLGRTEAELVELATAALRAQPGCSKETVVTIEQIPELKDGRNWTVGLVAPGAAADLERAKITVGYRLSREFHLLCLD